MFSIISHFQLWIQDPHPFNFNRVIVLMLCPNKCIWGLWISICFRHTILTYLTVLKGWFSKISNHVVQDTDAEVKDWIPANETKVNCRTLLGIAQYFICWRLELENHYIFSHIKRKKISQKFVLRQIVLFIRILFASTEVKTTQPRQTHLQL